MEILLAVTAIIIFIIAALIGLFYDRVLKSGLFKLEKRRDFVVFVTVMLAIAIVGIIVLFGYIQRIAISSYTPTPIVNVLTPTFTAVPPTANVLSPNVCSEQFFYGFESADMGWEAQGIDDTQAIRSVKQTTVMAKSGQGSLELEVNLDSSNPNKQSGETFINLVSNPPIGLVAPFNLEGVPITMWFFVPAAATANSGALNGVQIFVKDELNRSEYSDWGNLNNNTDRWIPFTFVPSREPPQFGHMDKGFDPTTINIIGFKIGTGKGSSTSYSGPVWIDNICWQKP